MTAFLGPDEVRRHLDLDALIDEMESALRAFSAGEVVQPVRQLLPVARHEGFFATMPAVTDDAVGAKLVTFYPGNAERGLDTHMATIALFEPETGRPLAFLDGTLITELRTAAVSAAATRRLAAPGAHRLALLGSGVQARSHLELLARVRRFDDVRVWSRTPEHARRFADHHGVTAYASAEEAVRGADVVVTATSATEPVLRGDWLEPGAHVNAIGACVPTWRELDDAVMAGTVYVDSREAAKVESGDIRLSGAKIHAELGELFAGKAEPLAERTTIFKSLGLAVEDVAAAKLVWRSYNAAAEAVP